MIYFQLTSGVIECMTRCLLFYVGLSKILFQSGAYFERKHKRCPCSDRKILPSVPFKEMG